VSTVETARTAAELRAFVPEWQSLARDAVEPNPFYEPFMLQAAFSELGAGLDLSVAFVRGDDGELVGAFPLRRRRATLAVPGPHDELWRYAYCYLCTPLIRRGREQIALDGFFGRRRSATLRLRSFVADGEFDHALHAWAQAHKRRVHTTFQYERPMVQTQLGPDAYFQAHVSPRKQKQLRRFQRRLAEPGPVRFRTMRTVAEVEHGTEQFITLEHQGWKGRKGTSFASGPRDRAFLVAAMRAGAQAGQVEIRSLDVGEQPVAMGITLRSGPAAFGFKIAYDEAHAENSPGVLLDVATFKELLADPDVALIDSCCDPGFAMHDAQWGESRVISIATLTPDSLYGRALTTCGAGLDALEGRARERIKTLDPRIVTGLRRVLR
jgi:CelD/BcsL family acetyltransferase involved in cellulose biosynthesis